MQTHLIPGPIASPNGLIVRHTPDTAAGPSQCTSQSHRDHQFVAMLNGYRASGGLCRSEEIRRMVQCRDEVPGAMLLRWMINRKVICFEWLSQTWFPWFQFQNSEMRPLPELTRVFAELTPFLDAWELANWFIQPNPWLEDRTPVDALQVNPSAILQAARADRFVAAG